jgi:2-keto-3-deoxy-galactonokinase
MSDLRLTDAEMDSTAAIRANIANRLSALEAENAELNGSIGAAGEMLNQAVARAQKAEAELSAALSSVRAARVQECRDAAEDVHLYAGVTLGISVDQTLALVAFIRDRAASIESEDDRG